MRADRRHGVLQRQDEADDDAEAGAAREGAGGTPGVQLPRVLAAGVAPSQQALRVADVQGQEGARCRGEGGRHPVRARRLPRRRGEDGDPSAV